MAYAVAYGPGTTEIWIFYDSLYACRVSGQMVVLITIICELRWPSSIAFLATSRISRIAALNISLSASPLRGRRMFLRSTQARWVVPGVGGVAGV